MASTTPEYMVNGSTSPPPQDGAASPSPRRAKKNIAHHRGNVTRLTEMEIWLIFRMLDINSNGLLYLSDVHRALEELLPDEVVDDDMVNHWMVRNAAHRTLLRTQTKT